MKRPWHIWTLFTLCLLAVILPVGWVSLAVLRLDRAEAEGRRQAETEEKIRLALWRLDSSLMALIVEESARPAEHYRAFTAPAGAYTTGLTVLRDVLVPSPLLAHSSSNVLIHFQLEADGRLFSPQVPADSERQIATNRYTTVPAIATAAARVEELRRLLSKPVTGESASQFPGARLKSPSNADLLRNPPISQGTFVMSLVDLNAIVSSGEGAFQRQREQPLLSASEVAQQQARVQTVRNSAEFNARANVYQQVAQAGINRPANSDTRIEVPPAELSSTRSTDSSAALRLLQPIWAGPELLFARRVVLDGFPVVQGVWVNWPQVKASLLQNIADLFPNAELRPIPDSENARGSRTLASVPVELVPSMSEPGSVRAWTALRLSLVVVWICLLLAVAAVSGLLYGAVSLSERRAAFVSAVTHELRTPLTTFKLYSEMLADGMIGDAAKHQHYLNTLKSEANRLSHLVENVLSYARLERGSARRRVERLTLGTLIERVRGRLEERAGRCDLQMLVDADDRALQTVVHVDVAAVEQILFNLVDNACKYAAPAATEKIIHLEASPDGKFAMLRVRDHGQGIGAEGAKRLFKPFSKSAQEAAHSAPGIGLGLALCHRLSRSLGGDLRLDRSVTSGACFELRLPMMARGPGALDSI